MLCNNAQTALTLDCKHQQGIRSDNKLLHKQSQREREFNVVGNSIPAIIEFFSHQVKLKHWSNILNVLCVYSLSSHRISLTTRNPV